MSEVSLYRGTSLIRQRIPSGPNRRPTPRVLWWSEGGRCFLISEGPLYGASRVPSERGHAHVTRASENARLHTFAPRYLISMMSGGHTWFAPELVFE